LNTSCIKFKQWYSKNYFFFSIELHKDDLNVLKYIHEKLGIGNIRINKDKCVFTVTNTEGTYLLISIFDKYNLNSTKYLDYLNFRKAFILYQGRNKQLLKSDIKEAKNLGAKLLELKNSMNTKRPNTTMPTDHKIIVTKS
jgi:hypothetical protein